MENKLKIIREKSGMSSQDVATKLGISKGYYSLIENQKRGLSYPMAVKISAIFKKKPDDIFFNIEVNKK